MTRTPAEILEDLAPSIWVLDKLEEYDLRTGSMSKRDRLWVQYWRAIRSDGPAITDAITAEGWAEIDEATGKYVQGQTVIA